ncbi:MAG: FAD-dependent oxidoreductase, partial [Gemmatimonadetes bacterium]|nr:FAD-dependent oxidoreductase [Gemmatimonadota bacterium]
MEELGHTDWGLFEAQDEAGGLSRSFVDDAGFTWDIGGHVLFSHYRWFDALMDAALGDAWVEHVREAWVWMRERWIPYPFQNNIWRLPPDDLVACLDGLVDLATADRSSPMRTFDDWLMRQFGTGLCDVFMRPYNFKVWAYPPEKLDVGWMGERVATVDLKRILANVVHERDEVGWGPNSTFRFPLRGGTGAIWKSVAGQLPRERQHYGRTVTAVDLEARRLVFEDGETVDYDALISSMPLDCLLALIRGRDDLAARAGEFVHSSSHIVGVGLDGAPPEDLTTKCWMYFPESSSPFYRVTVFSNYSPNNVGRPGEQWSLMAEVSESPEKPVDRERVAKDVVEAFRRIGFMRPDEQPVSVWYRRMERGYPTPWLGRDEVLGPVQAELERYDVFSRGRFGTWKYEVSNQDHSVMQGV